MPALCHLLTPFRNRVVGRLTRARLTCFIAFLGACSRTGLDAEAFDDADDVGLDGRRFADANSENIAPAPDAARDSSTPPESSTDAQCIPSEEVCNGLDDDCNGEIDDDIAPIPCPGGGYRYCVGGRASACPTRCEVCVPGSQRVCFISYCLYWGTQTCAADGRSFGPCREQRPPAACEATARAHGASPELERCCIDQGYCCIDAYDLDTDGNRGDLLGSCGGVSCQP